MKKIIGFIIFLILLALAGYWFGKIEVKPGQVVVVHSQISGTLDKTFQSDDFKWAWQNIIPNDVTTYNFPLGVQMVKKEFSFYLPQGKVPTLKNEKLFKIVFSLKIKYNLEPKNALKLVSSNVTNISILNNNAFSLLSSIINNDLTFESFKSFRRNQIPNVLQAIKEISNKKIITASKKYFAEYEIGFISAAVLIEKIPDLSKYGDFRKRINDLTKQQFILLQNNLKTQIVLQNRAQDTQAYLAKLDKLGVLFNKYPLLLQYIAIEKLSDKIKVAVIPSDDPMNKLSSVFNMFNQLNKVSKIKTTVSKTTNN